MYVSFFSFRFFLLPICTEMVTKIKRGKRHGTGSGCVIMWCTRNLHIWKLVSRNSVSWIINCTRVSYSFLSGTERHLWHLKLFNYRFCIIIDRYEKAYCETLRSYCIERKEILTVVFVSAFINKDEATSLINTALGMSWF